MKAYTVLLLVLLALAHVSSTTPLSPPVAKDGGEAPPLTHSGEPIEVLKDMKLYMIPVNCDNQCDTAECSYPLLLDHLYLLQNTILFYGQNVSETYRSSVYGRRLDSGTYYSDVYNMYMTVVKYENIELVYTSIGYFKAVYRSGKAPNVKFFGKNLSHVLEKYIGDVIPCSSLRGLNVTVVYGGIDAETRREIASSTCIKTAEGVVCNETGTRVEYTNPYEKYYIVIDGVRIGFPIKIRGYMGRNESPSAQYVEGFLPCKCEGRPGWERISIDDTTIQKIRNLYLNAFKGYSIDDGDIVIDDIYYALAQNSMYIVPQIVVSARDSGAVAVIQLTEKGPVLVSKAVMAGPYSPSDPSIVLNQSLFTKIPDNRGAGSSGGARDTMILLATLLALVALPMILLVAIARKSR